MARSMASIVACSSTNLARASTVFSRSNGAAMIFAKARRSSTKRSRAFFRSVACCSLMTTSDASTVSRPQSRSPMHRMLFDALSTHAADDLEDRALPHQTFERSVCPSLSFPNISSGRDSRREAESSHLIRVDAFEGAKLSHGETVSGKAKGRPQQEGRHPRCRPRARAHPPSIRPSPPGTVQGLLRRAHILFAQHQRNHGTVQTQTSTTPHDQSGTQGTRHSGTGAGHHPNHQAADEDPTAVRTLRWLQLGAGGARASSAGVQVLGLRLRSGVKPAILVFV